MQSAKALLGPESPDFLGAKAKAESLELELEGLRTPEEAYKAAQDRLAGLEASCLKLSEANLVRMSQIQSLVSEYDKAEDELRSQQRSRVQVEGEVAKAKLRLAGVTKPSDVRKEALRADEGIASALDSIHKFDHKS